METQSETVTTITVSTENKMSQKDATYCFIMDALKVDGLGSKYQLPEGTKLKDIVTKEIRKVVRQNLFKALAEGTVGLTKVMTDSRKKKYCSGLVNHWLKKDPRFN